jgi:L-asparagine transporter-like permease
MIKVIAIVALIVTGAVMIVLQTKVKGGTAADPHKVIPMNALMTSSTILFVVVILNYVMPARIFDVVFDSFYHLFRYRLDHDHGCACCVP